MSYNFPNRTLINPITVVIYQPSQEFVFGDSASVSVREPRIGHSLVMSTEPRFGLLKEGGRVGGGRGDRSGGGGGWGGKQGAACLPRTPWMTNAFCHIVER